MRRLMGPCFPTGGWFLRGRLNSLFFVQLIAYLHCHSFHQTHININTRVGNEQSDPALKHEASSKKAAARQLFSIIQLSDYSVFNDSMIQLHHRPRGIRSEIAAVRMFRSPNKLSFDLFLYRHFQTYVPMIPQSRNKSACGRFISTTNDSAFLGFSQANP